MAATSKASAIEDPDAGTDADTTPGRTPAGAQMNSEWNHLREGVGALCVFLHPLPLQEIGWHVIFRCGTVANVLRPFIRPSGERTAPNDTEFAGYDTPLYDFPDDDAQDDGATVDKILEDNRKVWESQRKIPGDAGRAVRCAYQRLIEQGYPYGGTPEADRSPVDTGILIEPAGRFWIVNWRNLGVGQPAPVFNICFSAKAALAAGVAGDLRRSDYMFPEVAAAIAPDHTLWMYGPDGTFGEVPMETSGMPDEM